MLTAKMAAKPHRNRCEKWIYINIDQLLKYHYTKNEYSKSKNIACKAHTRNG